MKIFKCLLALCVFTVCISATMTAAETVAANEGLKKFSPVEFEPKTLTMPDGEIVNYRAYEHIFFVTHVEDSTYQTLNIYVPESAIYSNDVPIFLRTYVGGFMAAKASEPSALDATGRALSEGYVVCIPGARGSNSAVTDKYGKKVFTGRMPAGLLDLKAAVRYLRSNNALIPGDSEKIITDGTSAGGAMSSLLGATGNAAEYEPYLKAMGAADARDDIFAAVCYCPIIDLDHSDMAYEWLYSCTNTVVRGLNEEQQKVSKELASAYPAYLNDMGLTRVDNGQPLTDKNCMDYIKYFLVKSAQRAKDETCVLSDTIGIKMNEIATRRGRRAGDFVTDIDMNTYLSYVASTQALKTPPSFDAEGILGGRATPENQAFGDANGGTAHFTAYSMQKMTGNPSIDAATATRVKMMNPMNFIGREGATTAKHWYIRHGAKDRDTSFNVPVMLATKLMNKGYSVDFALPWNRPHSGDYNLDDLFEWIEGLL